MCIHKPDTPGRDSMTVVGFAGGGINRDIEDVTAAQVTSAPAVGPAGGRKDGGGKEAEFGEKVERGEKKAPSKEEDEVAKPVGGHVSAATTNLNGVRDFDGELYGIYCLRRAQGNGMAMALSFQPITTKPMSSLCVFGSFCCDITGLGRAMVRSCFRKLRDAGHKKAIVWVLDTNTQAIGFYKKLGARKVPGAAKVVTLRAPDGEECVIREVAFAWDDISVVLAD